MEEQRGITSAAEPGLSLKEEKLIRNYLWKLFAFPGAVVAILIFVAGLYMSEILLQKARNDAFSVAQRDITAMISQVMDAKHQVKESEKAVALAVEKVQKTTEQAEKFSQQLTNLEQKLQASKVFMATDPEIKKIVDALVVDPRVIESIDSKLDSAIRGLKLAEDNLTKALSGLRVEFKDMETDLPSDREISVSFAFPVKRAWLEFPKRADLAELEISGIQDDRVTIRPKNIGRPGPRAREPVMGPLKIDPQRTRINYRVWAVGF
jgi:hypothetical protein